MEYRIKISKTQTGTTQVQIVYYHKRKTIVVKHVGSSNDKNILLALKTTAENWIKEQHVSCGLFSRTETDRFEDRYEYLGSRFTYAYEFLERIYTIFKFNNHTDELFKDLVIARILEPGSKKNSLEFLREFLDKDHSEGAMYKRIVKYDDTQKDTIEKDVVEVAQDHFGFDFSFVLYDVTTLYFESFHDDEFKKAGFSKDNKSNQPQVVIGLIVTKEGFPVSYQIWKGNTFEGSTFLPIVEAFKRLHNIKSLTIVADSAMLSKINMDTLTECGLNYIVGARLSNLKKTIVDSVLEKMKAVHGHSVRVDTLIVDYSQKRYAKDKKDLDKQIEKAKKLLNTDTFKNPRAKYLKTKGVKNTINQELIDKNTKLLGLKGYTTNLTIPNEEIIEYYHNLFKVEHAWRIAKSDLEARPIYHSKEESIKNHILICFMALSISVYLELKNKSSVASIVHKLKSVTDAKILNKLNKTAFFQRVTLGDAVRELERLSYE